MLAGPSETGKTVAQCAKLLSICLDHPNAQTVLCRKTFASIANTVFKTLHKLVRPFRPRVIGGTKPKSISFSNGSEIVLEGLDHPDRLLSGEFDAAYVNQAEELSEHDWEYLGTRTTGRAGNVPKSLLFGDCNPAGRMHWIPQRSKAGKLSLFNSRHQDNPRLFDDAGKVTAEGRVSMERLDSLLTGVRRKRLWEGLWSSAEGAVYDTFDSTPEGLHVKERSDREMIFGRMTLDVGYTHPSALLLVLYDLDLRWHVRREFYKSGVLPSQLVELARDWFRDPLCRVEYCVVDEAAAGLIADLEAAGVTVKPGKGKPGGFVDEVGLIQDRLKVAGDGKPRLTVDPSCVNTIMEFDAYRYDPKKVKEAPIKEFDHSMDALRYLAVMEREPDGVFTARDRLSSGNFSESPLTNPDGEIQFDVITDKDL